MISRVFLAYILIAIGAIPTSLVASPTAPADAEVPGTPAAAHPPNGNATLAPAGQTPAHLTAPANSTASANVSAAAGHPPANASSGPNSGNITDTAQKEIKTNQTSSAPHTPALAPVGQTPAHPIAPANSTASGNVSAAAGHPPANATSGPNSGNATDTAQKETKTNQTSAVPHAPVPHADSPPTTTCFHKSKSHGIENHHCDKALDKVVYSTNQTLDKFSSLVFVNYKTCNINIRKPQNGTLKKVDLSSMVHNLTNNCHSVGGVFSQSSKVTIRIERGTKENVHDVDIPVCKKEECPLTQSDCLSAFYQLPIDPKGIFINGKGKVPFARATSGNCTVTASTTDLSAFVLPRQFVLPTMKNLVNQCGEHPGKIYLSGGTKGYNGDIWLSARASNKDMCH